MIDFVKKCKVVNEKIDGIGPWFWTASDHGLWNITKDEWPNLKTLWSKHVTKYRVCVQAGGACGMYPRLLSETFDKVYTFEPDPLSFHCLTNNCQTDNIYKYHAAIGDTHQLVKLYRKSPHNVGENLISAEHGDYEVPMLMIDDLALDICDFIQLDVELYEYQALLGAKETIKKCHPVISCENGGETCLKYLQTLAPYQHVGSYGIASHRADYGFKLNDDVYKVV